ncbi:MAG: polysaccharide biosynthesis/export family protein [Acidobacteriales bacterium]|nr:polysaccharide biosynthesis/export family protein [Terriglobales bacterium]
MKYRLYIAGMFLAGTTLLAQDKTVDPPQPPTPPAAAPETAEPKADPMSLTSGYLIGAQDVLSVSVWKEPNLSGSVPVRPDGKISLPLLHDVQAAGFTPMQLADDLTAKLKKFVVDPQVSVVVTQVNSSKIYILGEVSRPGPMPMLSGMTALQAIASAGGPTQFANQKKIYILRSDNGTQQKLPFNYKKAIKGDQSQNIMLKTGDTVVVP